MNGIGYYFLRIHNPEVTGSTPVSATRKSPGTLRYVDFKDNNGKSKYYALSNRIEIDKTILLIEEITYDSLTIVWRVYDLVEDNK